MDTRRAVRKASNNWRRGRPAISIGGTDQRLTVSVHGALDDDAVAILSDIVETAVQTMGRAERVEVDLRPTTECTPASLEMVARIMDLGVGLRGEVC